MAENKRPKNSDSKFRLASSHFLPFYNAKHRTDGNEVGRPPHSLFCPRLLGTIVVMQLTNGSAAIEATLFVPPKIKGGGSRNVQVARVAV